jgi:hypothetical protein
MLLCSLYLIRFQLTKKKQLIFLFLLGLIIFLSFSRSAMLMYAMIFLCAMNEKIKKHKVIFFTSGGIFILTIIFYAFLRRSNSIEEIDRFKFMMVFFDETQDWNFFKYLIGAPRITPLSESARNSLSFFEGLFSYSGNGDCYSVVFHSFLLRVIFDHGITGLVAIIFFTYRILIFSNIDKKIIWVTISIFILNGLSVSSFNSVFFPVSMIFLMGTKYNTQKINIGNL